MFRAKKSIDLHVDVTDAHDIQRAQKRLSYYKGKLRRKVKPAEQGKVMRDEMFRYADKIGVTHHTAGGAFKLMMHATLARAYEEGTLLQYSVGARAARQRMMDSKQPAEVDALRFVDEDRLYPKVSRFLMMFLVAHGYDVPAVIKMHV